MHGRWRRFRHDETGAITPLMLVLFIGILLMTGISLDMLKHEAERADLQAALDRGVLAATALTQTLDAETVIADYVLKGVGSDAGAQVSVIESGGPDNRRIEAAAGYATDAMFLGMIGQKQLGVGATAAAAEGMGGANSATEISLVLDISGTMHGNGRLENLQAAASRFVDRITAFGASSVASVNLVPYAGQVNPGPWMFAALGGVREHEFSSCLEITDRDYLWTGLPDAGSYAQVPHFQFWQIEADRMDWGWCPSDDAAITYVSSDAEALKAAIGSIRLHDGTGTYHGMKWGLALLDPSSRQVIAEMIMRGDVSPDYAGRPLDWQDPAGRKYIVLMTAGQMTDQNRPDDPADPALETEEVLAYGHPWTRTLTRVSGQDHLHDLCRQARSLGVVVFSIAFEASETAQHEMRDCASSPSHFFAVEGLEIRDAFDEIATTIQKLRLVL